MAVGNGRSKSVLFSKVFWSFFIEFFPTSKRPGLVVKFGGLSKRLNYKLNVKLTKLFKKNSD